VARTFLLESSRCLPLARVLAILGTRFVLPVVLGGSASGVVRSRTGRQFDEFHAESVAQDPLRFFEDRFESSTL